MRDRHIAGRSRRHMHRDDDGDNDDTIWSFAPEACDNITAMCYVLHGRRMAWELLTPTWRTQSARVGHRRLHTCQGGRVSEGSVQGRGFLGERTRGTACPEVVGACSAGFSVFGFVGFVRSLRRRRPFFLGLLPAHEVGSFLPPFAPLSWDLYDPRS